MLRQTMELPFPLRGRLQDILHSLGCNNAVTSLGSSLWPHWRGSTPRGLRARLTPASDARLLVQRIGTLLRSCIGAALLFCLGAACQAQVPGSWIRSVPCGQVVCGSMEIAWYRRFFDGDPTPAFERQGVNIRGRFRGFREQAREFHYLQVITRFEAGDFRWSREPAVRLPPRFVDAPPFGMQQHAVDAQGRFHTVVRVFDALPWYDEGEFPVFDDRPRAFLASARRHGVVAMEFETWLVCVIDASAGPDPERVSDDRYEVAALIGWSWGYEIVHEDRGVHGVDELEDYTFNLLPMRILGEPTDAFEAGLGATLGGRETDRFNILLGDAARCRRVPW